MNVQFNYGLFTNQIHPINKNRSTKKNRLGIKFMTETQFQITKTHLPFDYNPTILPVIVFSHLFKGKSLGFWTHLSLFHCTQKNQPHHIYNSHVIHKIQHTTGKYNCLILKTQEKFRLRRLKNEERNERHNHW